jgi:hypothetical protein
MKGISYQAVPTIKGTGRRIGAVTVPAITAVPRTSGMVATRGTPVGRAAGTTYPRRRIRRETHVAAADAGADLAGTVAADGAGTARPVKGEAPGPRGS